MWLAGMMGAGKSTVGRTLAQRLSIPFVDADLALEKKAGRRIPEIFADDGEAAFRDLEEEILGSLAGQDQVVALGGGALGRKSSGTLVRESGTLIYLQASLETLLERIGKGRGRPLLEGLGEDQRRERLADLMEQRLGQYERAHITVDTDGRSLESIVTELVEELRRRRES